MATEKRKILLLALVFVIIATVTGGYLLWNKPHKNIIDAEGVKVTAPDLYNIFINDSLKAKNLYTDKVVVVYGEVEKLSVNQQSQNIILMKTPVADAYINCTLEEKAGIIKEHDLISLKGICSGYIGGDAEMGLPGDVFLTRCYLTK